MTTSPTPTRDELADMILDHLVFERGSGPSWASKVAADVVLPLLADRDARIAELEAQVREQSFLARLAHGQLHGDGSVTSDLKLAHTMLGEDLETIDSLVAERDAALAQNERLKHIPRIRALEERDAALSEIERLTKELGYKSTLQRQLDRVDAVLAWDGTGRGRIDSIELLVAERDAWREDADRLAAAIKADPQPAAKRTIEALAAHDALKAGNR